MYIFIIFIVFLIALSYFIVRFWRKKYFVKEIYIEKGVSTICLISDIIFSGWSLIYYCIINGINTYEWRYMIVVLIINLICLYGYFHTATTCIYLKDEKLIRRNIFYFKQISINKETKIIDKSLKRIIKSGTKSISFNSRYLDGNFWDFLYKIQSIINDENMF